jgi:peptidoglycan/LPS O-acetylase OafA/YrhL
MNKVVIFILVVVAAAAAWYFVTKPAAEATPDVPAPAVVEDVAPAAEPAAEPAPVTPVTQ